MTGIKATRTLSVELITFGKVMIRFSYQISTENFGSKETLFMRVRQHRRVSMCVLRGEHR